MSFRFVINNPNKIKSFFCKHSFISEINESKPYSSNCDDKWIIKIDICKKCGIEYQETLQRPRARKVIFETRIE